MTSVEKEVIQYEVASNGIATIWLNRPHKRNCVSPQLLKELEVAVDRAHADEKALAVVFRGRGNTFCSGADSSISRVSLRILVTVSPSKRSITSSFCRPALAAGLFSRTVLTITPRCSRRESRCVSSLSTSSATTPR